MQQMPRRIVRCCSALALACATGCTSTVLVTEAAPMRLGPESDVRVYTLQPDGRWLLSPNRVRIPEGWYVVPPSFVEP